MTDERHSAAPAARSTPFRADVEGLRGVAILLVVLFHAGFRTIGGGFIGVDVFFVLSGYLITGLLVNEYRKNGRIGFFRFYARRARRLLPAAALMAVVTIAIGAVVFSPLEQTRYSLTALATSAYAGNLWFIKSQANYFASDVALNPFLHTWSLAVEEQFYLAWPLLVVLGLRGAGSLRRLVSIMLVVGVVSFAACVWFTRTDLRWAFYGTPARAWEFALGGLAGLIPAAVLRARPSLSVWLGWAGLIGIVASALLIGEASAFPGAVAFWPGLATTAALVAGVGAPNRGIGRLLDTPPMQFLGKLSYSWYLWHWPALVCASMLAPSMSPWGRMGVALVALAVAALSYRLVEHPIRSMKRLADRPRLTMALAASLTTASILIAAGWHTLANRASHSPSQLPFFTAANTSAGAIDERCMSWSQETDLSLKECHFGDTTSATTLVAIGDSHLGMWFPALDSVVRQQRWRLVAFAKASCPSAAVRVYQVAERKEYTKCEQWREAVFHRVAQIRPAAVLLASFSTVNRSPTELVSFDEWRRGFLTSIASWDSTGARTIILRDTPSLVFNPPICLSRAAHSTLYRTDCAVPRAKALDTAMFAAGRAVGATLPRVGYIDLSDRFCTAAACPSVRDGRVLYRDGNHIAADYARFLAPALGQELVAQLSAR